MPVINAQGKKILYYFYFILGVLFVAIAYNIFILPTNIVYGVGGLGVIFKRLWGLDPSITIFLSSLFLLFLSFVLLGKEKTRNSIIGSLLYPLFVKLTQNIGNYINITETETLVMVLFGAVLTGIGLGLVFKAGFTTGGTDILNQIVSKYFHISLGNSMFFTDGVIVISGVFVFGWTALLYSIISLYILSILTDKVVLGISESKAFYIITSKEEEMKEYLLKTLNHGVTVLDAHGGYTKEKTKVLMCIIPTKEYFRVKQELYKIDEDAFYVVTDAYEVFGGE